MFVILFVFVIVFVFVFVIDDENYMIERECGLGTVASISWLGLVSKQKDGWGQNIVFCFDQTLIAFAIHLIKYAFLELDQDTF